MSHQNTLWRRAIVAGAAALSSASVLASGPLNTNPNDPDGVERWPNAGQGIPFNVDQGGLGPLNNADATQLVLEAFQTWENIPTATATYSNNGTLPFDVDETNFAPFVDNLFFGGNTADGLSPIVFDEDGAIFLALFGSSGVLGFASTDTRAADGTPIEAVSFLNGGSILGGFPLADFAGVTFHEFGHYSGLGHTVVNGQNIALGDTSGPTPLNTYGSSPGDQTETMYPFALQGGGQATPHADDIGFYSFLYPAPGYFANSGTITGQVLAPDGSTGLTGVNVIARNVANPFVDAVSAISGDRPGIGGPGTFTINGLTPGAAYTVHIDQILQGGFSTPPIQLPGPEEFWNAGESDNVSSPDDPADSTAIIVQAGTPSAGVDIIFNTAGPGDDLNLGDDDNVQVFLPFEFRICGQAFDSVFINSNGSLTFGAGDNDFSESAADHLLGPPRIAGLFDDLNPTTGGRIFFEEDGASYTVTYENVPEFFATGGNTFSITLSSETATTASSRRGRVRSAGGPGNNLFSIDYGTITAADGIAGYSCGGGLTIGAEITVDLTEVDLALEARRQPALFEQFSPAGNPNDLSGASLGLTTTTFSDGYEPNNTVQNARRILLPFDTTARFTEITAGDVDFWQFEAEAGQTLLAEIAGGALDSVIGLGLVQPDGSVELIAVDDDGGAGVLSALQVPLSVTGTYVLGVSTFPDFDFTGDGFSTGRYGLSLQSINGFQLNLGDDDFAEVDIGFAFPFQGATYTSVFVNSNGNLTFGSGDTDFSESVLELLNDQPRIAPLWDDLSPNAGGSVIVEADGSAFTVTFTDVPEFFSTTTNTFAVTLTPDGNISVDYGVISAADGIAGITEGGGAADPGPTDLSAAPNQSNAGSVYEQFDFIDTNDLSNLIITYTD